MARLSIIAAVVGIWASASALGQTARWDPEGGTLAVGETTPLNLIFENCQAKAPPAPPKVDGMRVEYSSSSSSFAVVNGEYNRSTTYTYAVLLGRDQGVDIPSFNVETDKGAVTVPAVHFEPTEATLGSSGQTLDSAASSHLKPKPAEVWAGEIFQLNYEIDAGRSYSADFGRATPDWNPQPLVVEDWSQPERFDVQASAGSESRSGLAFRTRAVARLPGSYRLNPVSQIVNLSVGVAGFGFFQQRQYQQFSVTSDRPTVEVRPLPPAPAGFNGAVGNFRLVSKVAPESASVGEPVTWTLVLSGTGNWPDIAGVPKRELSKDFQSIQPQAKLSRAEGKLFDATLTEDAVLIPTKPGDYVLSPVAFTFFDPKSGTYQTLTTPSATVTIAAAAAAVPEPGAVNSSALQIPSAPEAPSGLPRDTFPESGSAAVPHDSLTLFILSAVPYCLVGSLWLALALQRARLSDPLRPRREARKRLEQALARLRSSPAGATDPERAALIRAWQQDSALYWGVEHAAPNPRELSSSPPVWSELWEDTDRALYGEQAALPSNWVERAESALASWPAPAFEMRRLFHLRNILPWLACIAIGVTLRASDAESAYFRGDFPAAERELRSTLAADPADWSARYNLSLALAQQNHWDEAAAQAASAFVQHPGDVAVRWQFTLASEKAGFAPEPLAAFLTPNAWYRFVEKASPAVWQRVLEGSAWVGAAAIAWLLLSSYGGNRRAWPGPLALFLIAAIAATASATAWRTYGGAGDERAAVIWRNGTLRSVPSEVDTAQKTAPLPAGSAGVADKYFLGWVRLAFENGETGWVRKEEVVWLWR